MKKSLEINLDKIQFKVEHFPEDQSPSDAFQFQDDIDYVNESIANGNTWAWCTVKVSAFIPGLPIEGSDYLGACSYADQADFQDVDGYFQDMKANAVSDLMEQLKNLNKKLREVSK